MLTHQIVRGLFALTCIPESWFAWLTIQNIFYICGMLGMGVSYYAYRHNKETSRLNKEKDAKQKREQLYDSLDNKYLEYLQWCAENVDADVFDISNGGIGIKPVNTPENTKKELIAFTMLLNIFERAYLAYNDPDTPEESKENQGTGWDEYIRRFAKRKNFQDAVETMQLDGRLTYDKRFEQYMDDIWTVHCSRLVIKK